MRNIPQGSRGVGVEPAGHLGFKVKQWKQLYNYETLPQGVLPQPIKAGGVYLRLFRVLVEK